MTGTKEIFTLENELISVRNRAKKISEDASWMKTPAALHTFSKCLEIHNEINQLLDKTIARVKTQNIIKIGGRF